MQEKIQVEHRAFKYLINGSRKVAKFFGAVAISEGAGTTYKHPDEETGIDNTFVFVGVSKPREFEGVLKLEGSTMNATDADQMSSFLEEARRESEAKTATLNIRQQG